MSNLAPRYIFFSWRHQAPHPQPPSLGRCRPTRDGNLQPRPLDVEETRPLSRAHQAHTVPGSCHGARRSQPNVAYLFTVYFWAKYRVRGLLEVCIVLFLIFPADTSYQAREQAIFWRKIHPCLHPARRRERYSAWHMCVLLRLLLLLLLPLPRGYDKIRAGDSRLGDGSRPFFFTKQEMTINCKNVLSEFVKLFGVFQVTSLSNTQL